MSTTGATTTIKSKTNIDKIRKETHDKKMEIKRDCKQQMETSFKEYLEDIHAADSEMKKNMDSLIKDYHARFQHITKDKSSKHLLSGVNFTFESNTRFEGNNCDAKIEHAKNSYRFRALYNLNNFENRMKELDFISKEKIHLELKTNARSKEKTKFTGQHVQNTQFAEDDLFLENDNIEGLQNVKRKDDGKIKASRSQDKQNPALLNNIYMELNTFHHGGEGVCIVLLGKAGTGKSATGNSILLRQSFQENAETALTEAHISVAYTKIQGKEVCVIDTPSMNDISIFDHDFINRLRKTIEGAVLKYSSMHIALLVVMKFGERFLKEDHSAIHMVKSFFESSMLSECGICLFTHGDISQKSKEDFPLWCAKQDVTDLGNLFKACGNRCTLFTNMTNFQDNSFREQQRNDLFEIIIRLKNYKVAEVLQSIKLSENHAFLPFYKKEIENFEKNVKSKMTDASRDILPTLESAIDKKIIEVKQLGYDQSITGELIKSIKEIGLSINVTIMNNLASQNVTQMKLTSGTSNMDVINRDTTNNTNSQTLTQQVCSRESGTINSEA